MTGNTHVSNSQSRTGEREKDRESDFAGRFMCYFVSITSTIWKARNVIPTDVKP